jgi:hypothetical protein
MDFMSFADSVMSSLIFFEEAADLSKLPAIAAASAAAFFVLSLAAVAEVADFEKSSRSLVPASFTSLNF